MATGMGTAIVNRSNVTETKRITVVAIYGNADDRLTAEYDFQVQRASFAP